MDDCRFDNWTRMLGKLQDRRAALKEMAGAGAALVALARADLGLAQELGAEGDVGALACGFTNETCSRASQCCSGKCSNSTKRNCTKKKGKKKKCRNDNVDGVCGCRDSGESCSVAASCCRGICSSSGTCRCSVDGDRCNTSDDCCNRNPCNGGFCKEP